MELSNIIEAILFYKAEPLSIKNLSRLTKRTEDDVRAALTSLGERLQYSGLRILVKDDEVTMGTASEAAVIIETMAKEELSKELSKASLETLSIILYKGPVTRGEIDYIRGVNSTFILRNLLIRGLIEKTENPNDQRSFLYKPTFALFEHIGITKKEELPDYESTINALDRFVSDAESGEEENLNTQKTSTEFTPSDTDADTLEESDAGFNYDDEELRRHHEEDRNHE